MLRAVFLSLLVLATAAPLASATQVDVNLCERYYVCHRVVAQPDPLLVCAAVGLGDQGVGACVLEDAQGNLCVRYAVGFSFREVCTALA